MAIAVVCLEKVVGTEITWALCLFLRDLVCSMTSDWIKVKAAGKAKSCEKLV